VHLAPPCLSTPRRFLTHFCSRRCSLISVTACHVVLPAGRITARASSLASLNDLTSTQASRPTLSLCCPALHLPAAYYLQADGTLLLIAGPNSTLAASTNSLAAGSEPAAASAPLRRLHQEASGSPCNRPVS